MQLTSHRWRRRGVVASLRRRLRRNGPRARPLAATHSHGDVKRGLFFSGRGALPFGNQIRSVRDLLERLLGGDALLEAPLEASLDAAAAA